MFLQLMVYFLVVPKISLKNFQTWRRYYSKCLLLIYYNLANHSRSLLPTLFLKNTTLISLEPKWRWWIFLAWCQSTSEGVTTMSQSVSSQATTLLASRRSSGSSTGNKQQHQRQVYFNLFAQRIIFFCFRQLRRSWRTQKLMRLKT